ncbi:MAG: YfaZ family outer membrane protein [Gammaproteobacteria bacterium]|nr:YfaZ family outer membrane protein [Gammaproteobacteria bacterium]MCZ6911835.1 YfaZ family outer membrane protein [Pseudomonadota bacterium]
MRGFLLFAGLLLLPLGSNSQILEISANDDAAKLGIGFYLGQQRLALDASWLHHQDKGEVIGMGVNVTGFASSGQSPVEAGLGVKLVYADSDNFGRDGGAVAPGGFVSYTFPNSNRFTLYGHLYFAPDILTFGDNETYREIELRLYYSVIDDAELFLGFRNIHVAYDLVPNVNFDTGLNIGIKMRF